MNNIKYIQFEPDAFLSDIDFQVMNDRQRGIYITLILYLYRNNGKLPNDVRTLFKLCNSTDQFFNDDWSVVQHKFIINDTGISHKRVTEEIEKACSYYEKKRSAGQKSGLARKKKKGTLLEHRSNTPRTQPELSKGKVSKDKTLIINKKFLLEELKTSPDMMTRWFLEEFAITTSAERKTFTSYAQICVSVVDIDPSFSLWITNTIADIKQNTRDAMSIKKMFIAAVNNKLVKMDLCLRAGKNKQ